MNVLNVAAGFLPIHPSDFGVDKVVNYDPLQFSKNLVNFIGTLSTSIIDVDYVTKEAHVDSIYPNSSVDIILSISPFGFSLMNEWLDNKLKPNGHVLAFGNKGNKWIKSSNIFSGEISKKYTIIDAKDTGIEVINTIIPKVINQYSSSATDLNRDTNINTYFCARKNPS